MRKLQHPLRTIRKARGFSLERVAFLCGLTHQELSLIELGKRRGTDETLQKVSKVLGVPVDVLRGEQ